MRRAMIVAGFAALALAACGRKQETKSAVSVSSDGQATIKIDGGKDAGGQTATLGTALPANLPAYVKVYPGGTVASSVTGISGGSKGGMIVYQTTATSDAVLGFHKKAAADAGLKTTTETAMGQGGHTFIATGANGANVNVTVAPTPNGTFVQMTYD